MKDTKIIPLGVLVNELLVIFTLIRTIPFLTKMPNIQGYLQLPKIGFKNFCKKEEETQIQPAKMKFGKGLRMT